MITPDTSNGIYNAVAVYTADLILEIATMVSLQQPTELGMRDKTSHEKLRERQVEAMLDPMFGLREEFESDGL